MDGNVRGRVERATVELPRLGGRGVLVPDQLIVTAAHCIGWSATGGMVLGDRYYERVRSVGEVEFKALVVAVEPVSDIAFLGEPEPEDDPEFDFVGFCEKTEPLKICTAKFELGQLIPVHVLTHDRGWVAGEASLYREGAPSLFVRAADAVLGGSSGGPVVNERGELLGVVSHFSAHEAQPTGGIPRPHLAGPAWIAKRIGADPQGG